MNIFQECIERKFDASQTMCLFLYFMAAQGSMESTSLKSQQRGKLSHRLSFCLSLSFFLPSIFPLFFQSFFAFSLVLLKGAEKFWANIQKQEQMSTSKCVPKYLICELRLKG